MGLTQSGVSGGTDFNVSSWASVDPLKLEQAACLWVGVDPSTPWRFSHIDRSKVEPIIQLLSGGFLNREFASDPTNALEIIANYSTSHVTRESLKSFALKRGDHPAFLFPPNVPQVARAKHSGPEPKEASQSDPVTDSRLDAPVAPPKTRSPPKEDAVKFRQWAEKQ